MREVLPQHPAGRACCRRARPGVADVVGAARAGRLSEAALEELRRVAADPAPPASRRPPDGRAPGDLAVPCLGEELRPDRAEQVHVSRPPDAHKTQIRARGRGDLRRAGASTCARCKMKLQAQAARLDVGPHAPVEEGDRRAGARRSHRAVRGRRDRARVAMAVKKHKPTSPGRRFATWLTRDERDALAAGEVAREGQVASTGGRNTHGRITSRHRGGGAKRRYRRDRLQAPQGRRAGQGRRDRVRPQPQRPHRAAALPRRREALHPGAPAADGGMEVVSGEGAEIQVGNCLPLARIPTGTVVHNVEMTPGPRRPARPLGRRGDPARREGGQATRPCACPRARCAWCAAECRATIGTIGNADHENVTIGKAGRNRHKGIRPQTRGTAMNPVDHPHGGGEGKTTAGPPPGDALGRPDARLPHAQEAQAVRPVHRARPPPREEA